MFLFNNVVFTKLMEPPFEPIDTCEMAFLQQKVSMPVAMISTYREIMLQGLVTNPPSTEFQKYKLVLWAHPKFLLKLVLAFYLK